MTTTSRSSSSTSTCSRSANTSPSPSTTASPGRSAWPRWRRRSCAPDDASFARTGANETQPSAVSARQNLIGKIPQIILEVIGTIERLELAAVQCRNALACGSPQRLQSQGILAPAPLESPKAVSHGFTGILVFARLDQALDKRVQFIGQADVSGRPVGC